MDEVLSMARCRESGGISGGANSGTTNKRAPAGVGGTGAGALIIGKRRLNATLILLTGDPTSGRGKGCYHPRAISIRLIN
jgi:hypothetical protein